MSKRQTEPAAWFQLIIGVSIVGWWISAAMTNSIVELDEGRTDILFHIAAELLMAGLLIGAGVSLRQGARTRRTTTISGIALGTLLYSSVNSSGYFAEQGAWWVVAMFAVLGVATIAAAVSLTVSEDEANPHQEPASAPAAGTVDET